MRVNRSHKHRQDLPPFHVNRQMTGRSFFQKHSKKIRAQSEKIRKHSG